MPGLFIELVYYSCYVNPILQYWDIKVNTQFIAFALGIGKLSLFNVISPIGFVKQYIN